MSRHTYGNLVLTSLIAAFGLIVLGGVVRVSGSGLGCPDWPLCHGQIIPPFNVPTMIEYSHRLLALLVSLLIILVAAFGWVTFRSQLSVILWANLVAALLIVQILLGAVTVLGHLNPSIVTLHLAVAESLLASLVVLFLIIRHGRAANGSEVNITQSSPGIRWFSVAVLVGTAIVILSGAYVRSSGATGACYSWPLCGPEALPFDGLQGIHMAHRLVTLFAFILGVATLFYVRRRMLETIWAKKLTHSLVMLFAVQAIAGLIVIHSGFTPLTRAIHIALASLVWIIAVALTTRAWQTRLKKH